jgi:plasmid maintenance system antidote protein VapI
MVPLGRSAIALAHALGVTPARINNIVHERHGIEKPHLQEYGFFHMAPSSA